MADIHFMYDTLSSFYFLLLANSITENAQNMFVKKWFWEIIMNYKNNISPS